ncbi:MAG: hypothetical protein WBP44_09690 [Gammaproteobacteria bacterium]
MSSTTVKTATEETSPAKKKPRGDTKKVAKTTARKGLAGTTGAKKKATAKKAVSKKSAARKTTPRNNSDKTVRSKHTAAAQQQPDPAPEKVSPSATDSAPEDTRSLSWMSAQAASALKAVKASQAEKGQAVLARTRKQASERHLDDDSLIRIAAEMPVDDEALLDFSTEQSLEVPQAAVAVVMAESSAGTKLSGDSGTPEASTDSAGATAETTTASTGQTTPALPTAPTARRSVAFQPALAAGLLFTALLLGYYFWPASNDSGEVVATQESREVETSAAATQESREVETPAAATAVVVPQGTTTADVATAPVAEPQRQSAAIDNTSTSTSAPYTGAPSVPSPTVAAPAITEPEPEPVPAPVESAAVVAPRASQPTQPAQAPVQQAQPAVPAQTNRRAPVQGYYPQQRRPAYPQYYYR